MAKKQLPARRRSRRKKGRYERTVLIGIIIAVIAIFFALWGPHGKYGVSDRKRPIQSGKSVKRQPEPSGKKQEKTETEARQQATDAWKVEKPALVAIVIDDLGQDVEPAREIASLPYKITFAVMPGLPHSRKVAELARRSGREVLLHLPMEYRNRNGKPAPGMLRTDMTPLDFLNVLSENIESVPGAAGVNNHEGSFLTENKEAMKFLMAELKARNLIFLDSLTTPESVAYVTAREFGLKAAKRDVFLDNESGNEAAIRRQLEELVRVAKERGRAVGIGHPHAATINVLRKWLAAASRQGIEIVPVSRIAN